MKKYVVPAAILALIVAALYFYQPAEPFAEGFTEDCCLSLLSSYSNEKLLWETAQSSGITWNISRQNFQYKGVPVTAEFAYGTRNGNLYICKVTMYAFQDIPFEGKAYTCEDGIYKLEKKESTAYLMVGTYMKTQQMAKLVVEYINPDSQPVYDSAVLSAENEIKSMQCA
ncbi:MAG: hypothetical protein HZB66_02575 [Candidatus Aenigmarchaeota archaeon]|nr:hypothetical protein [Candidatus Aenigmarchaeota archaeon]